MSNEVTVKRNIKSSPETAFQAFADGPTWSKWFSDNTQVDLKVGGRFTNDDKDTGTFIEIVPNRLLHFTWDGSFAGSQIQIRFTPLGPKETEVSLRHFMLATPADAQKMTGCWTWTLDNLASFLETGKPLTMVEWKAQHQQS